MRGRARRPDARANGWAGGGRGDLAAAFSSGGVPARRKTSTLTPGLKVVRAFFRPEGDPGRPHAGGHSAALCGRLTDRGRFPCGGVARRAAWRYGGGSDGGGSGATPATPARWLPGLLGALSTRLTWLHGRATPLRPPVAWIGCRQPLRCAWQPRSRTAAANGDPALAAGALVGALRSPSAADARSAAIGGVGAALPASPVGQCRRGALSPGGRRASIGSCSNHEASRTLPRGRRPHRLPDPVANAGVRRYPSAGNVAHTVRLIPGSAQGRRGRATSPPVPATPPRPAG
jgi:hypothetical protein